MVGQLRIKWPANSRSRSASAGGNLLDASSSTTTGLCRKRGKAPARQARNRRAL